MGFPSNLQDLKTIGDRGEVERLMVRGQIGHGLIDELLAISGEVTIDKLGRGGLFDASLIEKLKARPSNISLYVASLQSVALIPLFVRRTTGDSNVVSLLPLIGMI